MPTEQTADCELRIEQACDVTRGQLSSESGLEYEGPTAQRVSNEHEATLDRCEPPFALSQFFSGGAKNGAACERASQCASGACVDGKCATLAPTPLCDF